MKQKGLLSVLIFLSLMACSINHNKTTFKAEIIDVHEDSFLVVPTKEFKHLTGRIIVTRKPKNAQKNLDFDVGDIIVITHDGLFLESDPVQLSVVYDIKKE